MIQTQFAFAFFKRRLNRPAQAGHVHELPMWAARWRIAEIELNLGWIGQAAAEGGPHAWTRQTLADRRHAHKGEVGFQGTTAAFLNRPTLPSRAWQLGRQNFQLDRPRRTRGHARMSARTPHQAGTWWLDRGRSQPNPGVDGDFHLVPLARRRDSVQKG